MNLKIIFFLISLLMLASCNKEDKDVSLSDTEKDTVNVNKTGNEWTYYKTEEFDSLKVNFFYDSVSVEYDTNSISAWIKQDYLVNIYDDVYRKNMDYNLIKARIDCKEKTYRFTEIIYYFEGGTHEKLEEPDKESYKIQRESLAEKLYESFCGRNR